MCEDFTIRFLQKYKYQKTFWKLFTKQTLIAAGLNKPWIADCILITITSLFCKEKISGFQNDVLGATENHNGGQRKCFNKF